MLTAQEVYDQEICPDGALATPNVTYWTWEPNEEQCLTGVHCSCSGRCLCGRGYPSCNHECNEYY